ncbi:MAG: Crp/Fnr family transcriptional regulator [Bacteroidota bacterium]
MTLIGHLSSTITISKALEKEIHAVSKKITVPKGQRILDIDERCTSLYFIEKGLIRGFHFVDGKEITNWFAQESEFATCFYSFIACKPSFENLQALEDCELVELSFSVLQNLYQQFPETERIGRMITENYYIKLEERILSLQFKTAKERYQKLALSKPSLLQRASLGQIASYLGITQETLSRIRSEA